MSHAAAQTQPRQQSALAIPLPKTRPDLQVRSVQNDKKRILFVTSEFTDLIKTGGLGDVSAALPRALREFHDVRILLPGYRQVLESGRAIRVVDSLPGHAALPACKLGRIDLDDGLIVYVLLSGELYERNGTPYCDPDGREWPDNHIRFARLGLAAAYLAAGNARISWHPDLVHAHDWPAALAPAYMRWRGVTAPSIFTIHNLAYQGLIRPQCRPELDIPHSACQPDGMEFNGQLSFLKAGIAYADHITTVSASYAREITTEAFGCGLETLLQDKAERGLLSGIRNGIDESWQSERDPHLLQGFAADDWQGKAVHAAWVRRHFGLESGDAPLFVVVSRLVRQKGLDLTRVIAETIVRAGGQLAVIGRGEALEETSMRRLAERFPGRIGVEVGFEETLARRMFAGSDFLLMPSRYEPCGLSQMYAQRFGSLPIAHRTGGLADSIEDGVTGFLFARPDIDSYRQAVERALRVFSQPTLLHAMRRSAMNVPCYWRQTVHPYLHLYRQLLESRHDQA